ncbi:putative PDZ domain-containing protein 2, partial [Homarus americanus]
VSPPPPVSPTLSSPVTESSLTLILVVPVGDEILAVNGKSLSGLSHAEAIAVFKSIRAGKVIMHVGRRTSSNTRSSKSKSCDELDKME